MVDNIVTPEQVQESLNIVEKALGHMGPEDEYEAAMLKNQAIMTQAIASMSGSDIGLSGGPAGYDKENLPEYLAGKAIEAIPNESTGPAIFSIEGTPYVATIRASGDIASGETVIITSDGNVARPAPESSDAFDALVGSSSGAFSQNLDIRGYNIYETADLVEAGYSEDAVNNDGSVTLEPGDEVPIASTGNLSNGCKLLAVGAVDETDVKYYIEIDGEQTFGGVTNSPLGTVNDPFSFAEEFGASVPVQQGVEYMASLSPNASSSVDLVSRIHVQELQG
jgi:hypothetical protein